MTTGRTLTLLLLVVMTVIALVTPSSRLVAAQDTGSDAAGAVTLDLRAWLCPLGIPRDELNPAEDCQDSPIEGVAFELATPGGAGYPEPQESVQHTDQAGVVGWTETWIGEGAYVLREDGPSLEDLDLTIVDYLVGCRLNGDDSVEIAVEDVDRSSLLLSIPPEAAGGTVACDWYNQMPEGSGDSSPASVTIRAVACPDGYRTTDDCTEPAAGIALDYAVGPSGGEFTRQFAPDGTAIIGTAGPSTALYLATGVAADFTCVDAAGQDVALDPAPPWVRAELGYVSLDVVAGQELVCQWYVLANGGAGETPTASAGRTELTIYAASCPTGYVLPVGNDTDIKSTCHDAPRAGQEFFADVGAERYGPVPAGEDGNALLTIELTEPGEIELGAFFLGGNAWTRCAQHDVEVAAGAPEVTGQGYLSFTVPVEPGSPVHCDWYFA